MNAEMSEQAPRRERVPLWLVVLLVFATAWPSTLPQIIASWNGPQAVPGWMRPLQFLLVAPGFVALWAAWMNGGWLGVRQLAGKLIRWRASWGIYLAVLAAPPALMCVSILVGNLFGWSRVAMPGFGAIVANALPTFLVYLILNTEELAWRGYVLPRMQLSWSPLAASLVLGLIWTAFHIPYFFMRGGHPGGFTPVLFLLTLMPLSVVLARTYNATFGSVLLTHLLHQSINAWAESMVFLPRFAHTFVPLEIFIVLATLIAIIMTAMRQPMWTRVSAYALTPIDQRP